MTCLAQVPHNLVFLTKPFDALSMVFPTLKPCGMSGQGKKTMFGGHFTFFWPLTEKHSLKLAESLGSC